METMGSLSFGNTTETHFWQGLADEISQDNKIDSWPLMSSAWPMIALFLFYLHFSTKLGPKLMKDRPPLKIQYFMTLYNVGQIWLNGALFFYCFWKPGFASFVMEASCEHPHVFPRNADDNIQLHEFHRGAWYYLISKMLDLLDTMFMVAHKKTPSFLHLYHHSTMLLVVWFGFKYVRPIHTVFPSITNNLAHVMMYTYYLICLYNPGFGERYKAVKMAITSFQIFQFIAIIIHCVAYNYLCPVPKIILFVLFWQNSVFLVLFSNFFIKSYLNSGGKSKPEVTAPKKKVS